MRSPPYDCLLCSGASGSPYYPFCALCDPHGMVIGTFTEEQEKAMQTALRLGGRRGLFALLWSWGQITKVKVHDVAIDERVAPNAVYKCYEHLFSVVGARGSAALEAVQAQWREIFARRALDGQGKP